MSGFAPRYSGVSQVAATDWALALCHEHAPIEPGCQPAILDRHVYLDPTDYSTFQHMEYRAACHGCDWTGGGLGGGAGPENGFTALNPGYTAVGSQQGQQRG